MLAILSNPCPLAPVPFAPQRTRLPEEEAAEAPLATEPAAPPALPDDLTLDDGGPESPAPGEVPPDDEGEGADEQGALDGDKDKEAGGDDGSAVMETEDQTGMEGLCGVMFTRRESHTRTLLFPLKGTRPIFDGLE